MKIDFTEKLNEHLNKFVISIQQEQDLIGCKLVTVEDVQEQRFLANLKQNDLFKIINLVTTKHQQGEALGLVQIMAGTTDTEQEERRPKLATTAGKYHCQQMNIDGFIPYAKLDSYTGEHLFDEVVERFLNAHLLQSILMIGWHGKARNGTSNSTLNPFGQDVQKGWLQKIRDNATLNNKDNVLNVGEIGANGAYKTLTKAVKAGISKIQPIYTDGELVAICGRDIAGNNLIENNKDGLNGQFITRLQNLVGGCKAIMLPHFPSNAILLTRLDNLSFYVHKNNIRRGWLDAPKHDALEHLFSFNVDFVVEDFNACALLENIELED